MPVSPFALCIVTIVFLGTLGLPIGHSMIADPWGVVLATAPDAETFIVADLDLDRLEDIRAKLPSLANRRPEVYA